MAEPKVAKLSTEFYVNGKAIYEPPKGGVEVDHTNVTTSNTGRTQDGKMKITWVRTDIVTVKLKYNYLTGDQVKYMENLLQGKTFTFKYNDAGESHEISAYCGQTSYTQYTKALYKDKGGLYNGFSADIIEL